MGDLQSGRLLAGRFEIERAAGSGGMGTVYRARDLLSGAIVAVKLLHPGSGGSHDVERFAREAQILSELRHPGIVSYVAHGQAADGQRFLVMEWLEGQDLGQRLLREPLSVLDSIDLLTQVADALSLAHRRGVIHRDLKPTNLFLCNGKVPRVKILDFGIARDRTAAPAMTRTGMVIGTPEYMAPEQARGSQNLTPAADLFSLGCVLYECLTGTPPFVADHIAAVLVRILFEEPVPIEQQRPGISASLAGLVQRLLQKDPAKRPADAAELRVALAQLGEQPEPMLAVTLARPGPQPDSFAEQEQRLFSIVLVAPAGPDQCLAASLPSSAARLDEAERQALLMSLRTLGTSADFLANGSLIVTVSSGVSAQDQATQAARAALLIRERWSSATIALATGRGVLSGRSAVGEVVERAASSLRALAETSTSRAAAGIFVDLLSAKLLGGRFALTLRPNGALLLHEEREMDASRPLLGKPTPCVGREAELAGLEGMLTSCIDESEPRVALCTAPPGTGKSRLRHELVRRVEKRSEPVTVLLGRADLLHAGAAYRIIARALLTLCNIAGGEPSEEQRRRLQDRIGRHLGAEVRNRVIPLLGELCGVVFSEGEFPALREIRQQPQFLLDRLRWAALTWLAAECQAAPVLLILDDLHWGDALSIGLVDEALDVLRSAPLFVFALARPEVHTGFPNLWNRHRPQEIMLKGLGKRACERLIQQALGREVTAESVEWMVQQAAGNALFLEELIRAAAEGQPQDRPETVIATLQARIGHLDGMIRRTVLAAAIFGPTFWDAGVARVLGLSDQSLEVEFWLSEAVKGELIELHRSGRLTGPKEYGFRHALVRDAAYSLLSDSDRKLGHLRAAEYFACRTDQQVPHALLGYHYREAERFDQALQHYRDAGDSAANQILYEEAVLHYQQAEEALRHLPSTPMLRRQLADLLLSQAKYSLTAASPAITWQKLAQARELLEALKCAGEDEPRDRLRVAQLDNEAARLHSYQGQYAQAGAYFERVIPIAEEFLDHQLSAQARSMYGRKSLFEGQTNRGIAMLEPAVDSIERYLGMDIDAARAYSYLAMALGEGGRGRAALRYMERVQRWLEEHADAKYLRTFHLNICYIYISVFDQPSALRCIHDALRFMQQANELLLVSMACDTAALLYCRIGELDTALKYRHRVTELQRQHGITFMNERFEANHAEILLKQGHAEAAREMAERCARATRAGAMMAALIWAERIWGCALAKLGAPPGEVDPHLRESLSMALQVGNVMEALLTEIAWADTYLERGEAATARLLLHSARARITDEMLPCTQAHFLPLIQGGLQRCGAPA